MNRGSAGQLHQPRRLAAGALSLVLVISVIISALLLSLVFLYASSQTLLLHYRLTAEVQRNARSGLAYLLGDPAFPNFQPVSLDLYGQGNDSVQLEKRPWGLFDVVIARASKSGRQDTVMALVGSHFAAPGLAALYVADGQKPLSLIGTSQVVGDCYTPRSGIRPGFLSTHNQPQPKELVTGQIRISKASLPVRVDSTVNCLRDFSQGAVAAWLPRQAQALRTLHSISRSFSQPPLVWFQTRPATIQHVALSGPIVLVSTHKLLLESDARLDNVLIIAPVVVVKSGFQGRIQVFARDTIQVQADCQLAYPSALCAYNTQGAATVLLGERSQVSGIVLAATPTGSTAPSLLRMHESTRVAGQVYAADVLENCGQITGTVMCRRLGYATASSFYENYLVDSRIERDLLPADFLSAKLLNPAASLGILAWLP